MSSVVRGFDNFEAVHDDEEAPAAAAHENTPAAASEADEDHSPANEASGRAETSCPAKGRVATC